MGSVNDSALLCTFYQQIKIDQADSRGKFTKHKYLPVIWRHFPVRSCCATLLDLFFGKKYSSGAQIFPARSWAPDQHCQPPALRSVAADVSSSHVSWLGPWVDRTEWVDFMAEKCHGLPLRNTKDGTCTA